MSMTTLKIAEFISMFIAYTGVTVLLPAFIFRRILQNRRSAEQFLMCYTFGNFYIINIVFVVQLLHISNIFTLIGMTVLISLVIWIYIEKVPVREKLLSYGKTNRKVIQGKLGLRTILHRYLFCVFDKIKKAICFLCKVVVSKPIQWLFLGVIFVSLFWVYGRQIVLTYGYRVSDIPVHMNWINQMSRGNLFASGVYPFGFHCMIYYLHTVFRMGTYVLLCQFFFVQLIYAHLVLLAVLKMLCKSKYLPYAGTIIYIIGGFWARQTFSRYYATLPQEFGMIFVFPSIYFLICFFQQKKEELKEKETKYNLWCFAMAFSLTLAIHFYGTMIAGLCCIGIAFGFIFRFLQKEYFRRIMVTGIASIFLAVLPMGIAFATGTPLQGSLGWGMNVIKGTSNNQSQDDNKSKELTDTKISENTSTDTQESIPETNKTTNINKTTDTENVTGKAETTLDSSENTHVEQKQDGVLEKIKKLPSIASQRILEYVVMTDKQKGGYVILFCILALFPLGMLLCIFRREYGEMLVAVGASMALITILLCAGKLGLPPLMDPARCSIYFAYLFMLCPVLLLDGISYLIFMLPALQIPRNIVSFVVSIAMVGGIYQSGMVKYSEFTSNFVTNEAITCLDNIIYDNEDSTWTIVSANDETQMGLDHGWHYEVISFLREMEYLRQDTEITIPTKNVYFFIEKIPVSYDVVYDKSGQSISRKGAAQELPNVGGIGMYQGERRWVVMSRMYYWAQEFKKRYPNEMQVYYETDRFVCYKIEQNMYHLYNFAIDYGYNTVATEETEKN